MDQGPVGDGFLAIIRSFRAAGLSPGRERRFVPFWTILSVLFGTAAWIFVAHTIPYWGVLLFVGLVLVAEFLALRRS